ncbi:MAG: cupin domain-containing protein [Actinobacteria bacterium]|nr:cupin domain-containing protein [Actinomycetota bacterium]
MSPSTGPRACYEETFVVFEGEATFTIGGERVPARGGQTLVVPANTAHGFTNAAAADLRIVSIHPSDHVEQEWLSDGAAP